MKIYNSFDSPDPNRTVQLISPLADITQPCRKAEASKATVNWLSQSLTSHSSVDLKLQEKKKKAQRRPVDRLPSVGNS